MSTPQPGILLPCPPAGHYLTARLRTAQHARAVRDVLEGLLIDEHLVIGLGQPFVRGLTNEVHGLRDYPAISAPGVGIPSTQDALWAYIRGADPGAALDRARALWSALSPHMVLTEDVATFTYRNGRDLSGYVDGTENPKGAAAVGAAIQADGSSFVAVQRWVHDLNVVAQMPDKMRDETVGRARDTDEELADAPQSAHVKRSAQESYEPTAFMLRRSMPYGGVGEHGLYFVAFGADLDRYERVMRRMAGLDDGIADALFRFSRPVTGGYYWCPPEARGQLELRAIGG